MSGKSIPVRRGTTNAVVVGDWKAPFGIHWGVLKSVISECEIISRIDCYSIGLLLFHLLFIVFGNCTLRRKMEEIIHDCKKHTLCLKFINCVHNNMPDRLFTVY